MHEYRLNPTPPFSFELTASLLSPGSEDLIDVFDGKRYTRLLELDSRMRLALVSSLGAEQRPELIITLMNGSEQDERPIGKVLNRMLGMDFDLGPFYEVCRGDQALFGLSRDHYGLKPPQRLQPFEALALGVASRAQGVHFLRATMSPVAEEYSYRVAYAGHTFCAFPSPEVIADLEPKDIAKDSIDDDHAEQIHSLGSQAARGELDLKALGRRPLEDMLATLESRAGIDALGAQMTALCGYGRLDCFPLADPALRRWIAANVFDNGEVNEHAVADWVDQWGDVRGLVAFYIYAELIKQGEI